MEEKTQSAGEIFLSLKSDNEIMQNFECEDCPFDGKNRIVGFVKFAAVAVYNEYRRCCTRELYLVPWNSLTFVKSLPAVNTDLCQ